MSDGGGTNLRRIFGSLISYGFGGSVSQVVNFILVPVYTRFIIPAELGALDLAITSQALLIIVMRSGLPSAFSRLYFDNTSEARTRDLMTTLGFAFLAQSTIITALGFTIGPRVLGLVAPNLPFHPWMEYALLSAFLQVGPELQRRILQAQERARLAASLSAGAGVLQTALSAAFVVLLHRGGRGVLEAALVTSFVYSGVAFWGIRRELKGRFRREMLVEAIRYGAPLVPYHVSAWGHQFASRWALVNANMLGALGLVGIAARVTSPISVARDAFSAAFSPVFFSWRTTLSDEETLAGTERVSRAMILLGGLAVAGASTLGAWFVRNVMSADYVGAAEIVGLIASAQFAHLIYSTVGMELFFSRRTRWISVIFILSTTASLVVTVSLSSRLAAVSVGIGQVVGGLVEIAVAAVLAARSFPLPVRPRTLVAAAVISILGSAFSFLPPAGDRWRDFGLQTGLFLVAACALVICTGHVSELMGDVREMLALRRKRKKKGIGTAT